MAKGDYKDICNITRCDNENAEYFNHSTRRYYCKSCAFNLNNDPYNNRDAMRLFGHDLLTLSTGEDFNKPL